MVMKWKLLPPGELFVWLADHWGLEHACHCFSILAVYRAARLYLPTIRTGEASVLLFLVYVPAKSREHQDVVMIVEDDNPTPLCLGAAM